MNDPKLILNKDNLQGRKTIIPSHNIFKKIDKLEDSLVKDTQTKVIKYPFARNPRKTVISNTNVALNLDEEISLHQKNQPSSENNSQRNDLAVSTLNTSANQENLELTDNCQNQAQEKLDLSLKKVIIQNKKDYDSANQNEYHMKINESDEIDVKDKESVKSKKERWKEIAIDLEKPQPITKNEEPQKCGSCCLVI